MVGARQAHSYTVNDANAQRFDASVPATTTNSFRSEVEQHSLRHSTC